MFTFKSFDSISLNSFGYMRQASPKWNCQETEKAIPLTKYFQLSWAPLNESIFTVIKVFWMVKEWKPFLIASFSYKRGFPNIRINSNINSKTSFILKEIIKENKHLTSLQFPKRKSYSKKVYYHHTTSLQSSLKWNLQKYIASLKLLFLKAILVPHGGLKRGLKRSSIYVRNWGKW